MDLAELKDKISQAVANTVGSAKTQVELTFTPEPRLGDLTTNAALICAKEHQRQPRELASEIAKSLELDVPEVAKAEVAGPGFVNLTLTDAVMAKLAGMSSQVRPRKYEAQVVVTEYSDPNPFKVLHAGHLYTSIVGDAISNLIAEAGGKVHRVNFGGDVGLHVARTLWGILQELGGENPDGLSKVADVQRPRWLAKCYVAGNKAYAEDEAAKAAIVELNKRVYRLHEEKDHSIPLAKIYWECRQWSYDYFAKFYGRLGTKFEKYYPESLTAPIGLKTVRDQQKKGVYEESDGAVVFRGEGKGLHTRVFITSEGLPTYEAKDVGLLMAKWQDYHFDRSVVITGNDITDYMRVVLASVQKFEPKLVERTTHLTHGNVKLAGGVKMSSRLGNILGAEEVLDAVAHASRESTGKDDSDVALGAVKYAFLKQRLGPDVVFTPEESVSLEGNSGPYLQYAHARARSILRKAGTKPGLSAKALEPAERGLAWKISQYSEVLERSVEELMPHHICTYLYELAQTFNRFYEGNRVLGHEREGARLGLVDAYADVLKDGLNVLGIAAPQQL